jgi:hypothetical protein
LDLCDHIKYHFNLPLVNLSETNERLASAQKIYYSPGYMYLPRHHRFALVRFIATVMVEAGKPFEPLPKVADIGEVGFEKRLDVQHFLKAMK